MATILQLELTLVNLEHESCGEDNFCSGISGFSSILFFISIRSFISISQAKTSEPLKVGGYCVSIKKGKKRNSWHHAGKIAVSTSLEVVFI